METWDSLIKLAKSCHTKEAWSHFLERFGAELASTQSSRPVAEVFKSLKNDPQCLQYDPDLWAALLNGALASWDLKLGREISDFCQKVPSAKVAIAAAQVFIESGLPSQTRDIANRALRLKHLVPRDILQLQMIVCNSYVEQGKHTLALRLLQKMEEAITDSELETSVLAEVLNNMGRAHFFLGQYLKAASFFSRAHELHLSLKHWEQAARGLFNTAACYHNTGEREYQLKGFELVRQCRELSLRHDLKGSLSHCYAFEATDDYQRGLFQSAADKYKKALDVLPASETGFRRLHIISMLTSTYLRMGRFQQASKAGQKMLELAQQDKSERFRSRYLGLHAELYWEEGNVVESRKLLQTATKSFSAHGVNTLEELSALSTYYTQCAKLNEAQVSTQIRIAETLHNNTVSWREYLISLAQLYLTKKKFHEALKTAKECFAQATEYEARYQRNLCLLLMIWIKLAQNLLDDEFWEWKEELKKSLPMFDNPLTAHLPLIEAAISYRQGNMKDVIELLQEAKKNKQLRFPYPFIVQSWLATLSGHSPKLNSPEQVQIVARATSIYFAPRLEALDETNFRISGHYLVSLERHPLLAKLLHHLLNTPGHSSTGADLQKAVWEQSLATVGWQQKIRNNIMRLREFFPFTLAPLILHSDNQIRLFHEAIELHSDCRRTLTSEEKILKLLNEGPMSSLQLSNQIQISQATTKRILKKLTEMEKVKVAKDGRNVMYQTEPSGLDIH